MTPRTSHRSHFLPKVVALYKRAPTVAPYQLTFERIKLLMSPCRTLYPNTPLCPTPRLHKRPCIPDLRNTNVNFPVLQSALKQFLPRIYPRKNAKP